MVARALTPLHDTNGLSNTPQYQVVYRTFASTACSSSRRYSGNSCQSRPVEHGLERIGHGSASLAGHASLTLHASPAHVDVELGILSTAKLRYERMRCLQCSTKQPFVRWRLVDAENG